MIKLNPIQIVGAVLIVLLLVLGGCKIKSYGDARFAAGEAKVQKDWDKEKAKVAEAALRTMEAIRRIDAANAAKSAADAKRFHDERKALATDVAYWRDAYEHGRVQIGARFACPAPRATGGAGASGDSGTYGLTQADAGFLVGFAGERDRVASERNEAVNGWQTCRKISAEGVK